MRFIPCRQDKAFATKERKSFETKKGKANQIEEKEKGLGSPP